MQQPEARQTTQPPDTEILDPEVAYVRRKKTALWVTVALLTLSLVVLAVGLISATRTDNVPVAGYYPGITLSFGAFLGIVGIHLVENRRPMEIVDMRKNAIILCPSNASLLSGRWSPFMTAFVLMAAIIFVSIGVIASFFCAIVDGIIASEFIDIRPLQEDMCDFYTSGSGYVFDSYYTEMTCGSSGKSCKLKLRSNTCYCCYLYNCESTEYHPQYFEFTGVSGCWDVIHLHRLLWASVVLNVTGLFLGIIAAAILGAYKDMQKPTPAMAPSPAPPPHILYNPTQHMLTYAGFCPPGQNLPAYPNYPGTVQTTSSSFQGPSTPQMIPEGGPVGTTCPSEETQSQPPSQGATQMLQQGPTQEAGGGFMLTPNAPVLFGSAHSPFEKPPPYAY